MEKEKETNLEKAADELLKAHENDFSEENKENDELEMMPEEFDEVPLLDLDFDEEPTDEELKLEEMDVDSIADEYVAG